MRQSSTRADRSAVGRLFQQWRVARGLSQLALATEAGISTRHLGFIEIGRACPSRNMVLLLAATLNIPLQERNNLLLAAGYSPVEHRERLFRPCRSTTVHYQLGDPSIGARAATPSRGPGQPAFRGGGCAHRCIVVLSRRAGGMAEIRRHCGYPFAAPARSEKRGLPRELFVLLYRVQHAAGGDAARRSHRTHVPRRSEH